MEYFKRLAAATAAAVALTFGFVGVEAVGASPATVTVKTAQTVQQATPRAGQFCKNVESGKVVGNLICKYDPGANRNRWVVK